MGLARDEERRVGRRTSFEGLLIPVSPGFASIEGLERALHGIRDDDGEFDP